MHRRLSELKQMNATLDSRGSSADGPFIIDFTFFSENRENIESLGIQLSENYSVSLEPADEDSYWLAKGTTRPIARHITREQHKDWVQFMVEVGYSYNCFFSVWTITDEASGLELSSEEFDTEYD